ncbi:MAG: EamA family transporter [Anaerolineales bacterium]|nr:EamA family transporter [Anaerolineales bacterium]
MTPFVILIVLLSTLMHAGWNLLAHYDRSESLFYKRMLIFIILVGFFPTLISELEAKSLPPLAWLCVLGSGFSAGLYLFFLAKSFESSDFSVVYPVARSLPVIFIGIIDTLRGRPLTVWGWVGIGLVSLGCFLVPQRSLRSFSWRSYLTPTSVWMLLTALGTIGYTYLDKIAAEVVQQSPATAARYGYIYFAISFIPYSLFLHYFSPPKPKDAPNHVGWKLAILAAILSFGAYWLILWAYQLSPYASYIVAFRQFSIVIGSAVALSFYKEGGLAVRLAGALLITVGLIFIAVLGR